MAEPEILDAHGRPIRRMDLTEDVHESRLAPIAHWAYSTSRLVRGLTPDGLAQILDVSAESNDPHEYMLLAKAIEERYGHYASVLGVRRRAVSQLEIQVGSADEKSPEANRDADLVRRWTERPEMVDEIDAMLDAVAIGFSVSEIAWETSERDWWPARLAWVHPAYLRLDETRTQLRLRDGASPGGEPLAPGKFVELHLRATTQLPMRSGATRLVSWFWLFQAYGLTGWVRLAEIHGLPIRLGRYHAGASEADRRKLLRAASNIGRDAAAIVPDTMSLELLDHKGAGAGSDLHLKLQQYMDHSTSKVVLGQTTTTDAISGGHAVSREHELVREDIQRADAREVAAVLARVGRLLVELNHGPREAYPSLRLSAREQFDTDKQSQVILRGVRSGMRVSNKGSLEQLGLVEAEDDDDVLVPLEGVGEGDGEEGGEGEGSPAAASARPSLAQARPGAARPDPLDAIADSLADEGWERMLDPLIEPVLDDAREAPSYTELRKRLVAAVDRMDDEALRGALARAGFAAAGETLIDEEER